MIRRFRSGNPIETDAVLKKPKVEVWSNDDGRIKKEKNTFSCLLLPEEKVYGLGENVRGLNKRGWHYVSECADNPSHCEQTTSLYGAHNFMMLGENQKTVIGLFVDTPSKVTFDVGYTNYEELVITIESENYEWYIIETENYMETIREFRELIGQSYIAPKWAFGFGQSRWSYDSSKEVRQVVHDYRQKGIPLDSIYLDIDYMERYKDFTINKETFGDFDELVKEMKEQKIHLVPIIDGGVKKEDGYSVYEEGKEKGYFCKDEDGEDFVIGVWPGKCCFPDMLNEEAARWFGDKYKFLTDKGIDGFWNDMNEPAIFYSEKRLQKVFDKLDDYRKQNLDVNSFFEMGDLVSSISNNPEDYAAFYHNYKGKKFCHKDVHNLFGYYMTRAAAEAFERNVPDKRILLFSRASYIGMHRYGGIWQGDNASWWSHLKMSIQMTPSLNMCGFLYTGADIGGFGGNTTEDLLLRWLEFGVFTPLMRNHSARGTRRQEITGFPRIELFRNVIGARYRLLPYIYSEYMKAALQNKMMFLPLSFLYEDKLAGQVEDQLFLGENIMIAPVYEQNADGRYVYFPEDMQEISFENQEVKKGQIFTKGVHYVEMKLGSVHVFLRENHMLPLSHGGSNVPEVDFEHLELYAYGTKVHPYKYYSDNGEIKDICEGKCISILTI